MKRQRRNSQILYLHVEEKESFEYKFQCQKSWEGGRRTGRELAAGKNETLVFNMKTVGRESVRGRIEDDNTG